MESFASSGSQCFQFNENNYAAVFKTHWRKLYSLAYKRVRDSELAKDLVQEVFTYCWQQKDRIQINTSMEAYLRSALQYQIIAHFRKMDIRERAFSQLYEQMVKVEEHMRDILTEQDLARSLNAELEKMSLTMREIYRMRFQSYSVKEIASTLNIAEKTVRNNISLGLNQLRVSISKDFPEDFPAICMVLYLILQ